MLIETEFDGLLEDDIVLEETNQVSSYEEILKNSENLIKSYLYLKKLMNASTPFVNAIVKASTIDTSSNTVEYVKDESTGLILVKNIDIVKSFSIYINEGEFILFPYESIEIPTAGLDKLELNGNFSILETKFGI